MVMIDPAKELYVKYRFTESVAAYRRQLREAPDNWANIAGIGHSLMATGDFAEAIPWLERTNQHYIDSHPGAQGCERELSICHWLIGERNTARDIVRDLVVAVRDGKVWYTDIAGGVSQGLILCYMASTLHATPDVDLAMKYLGKLAKGERIRIWPGPAALFLLGGLTFGEAVKDATGSADLAQAKAIAEQHLLKRRQLVDILFAAATERRMSGDEAGCSLLMKECASLTHPQVEYIWYLAKGEAAAAP